MCWSRCTKTGRPSLSVRPSPITGFSAGSAVEALAGCARRKILILANITGRWAEPVRKGALRREISC